MKRWLSTWFAVLLVAVVAGSVFQPLSLAAQATAPAGTATLIAEDIKFDPSTLTVKPGETITLINQGVLPHNFSVNELHLSVDIDPGIQAKIVIPNHAKAGSYIFYCNVPGHREAGMLGTLIVASPSSQTGTKQEPITGNDATIAALQTEVANLKTQVAGGINPTQSAQAQATAASSASTPHTSGPLGSRGNPVPVGQVANVGSDWTVTVVAVNENADVAVQAENGFNQPPPAGTQFFMVTLKATYHGSKQSDQLPFSISFNAVGASGVAYDYSSDCGVIPNELPSVDVFQGATVQGNVCWAVKTSDVVSLVMYASPLFTLSEERVFFSMKP